VIRCLANTWYGSMREAMADLAEPRKTPHLAGAGLDSECAGVRAAAQCGDGQRGRVGVSILQARMHANQARLIEPKG
jgi:hypothetical protein